MTPLLSQSKSLKASWRHSTSCLESCRSGLSLSAEFLVMMSLMSLMSLRSPEALGHVTMCPSPHRCLTDNNIRSSVPFPGPEPGHCADLQRDRGKYLKRNPDEKKCFEQKRKLQEYRNYLGIWIEQLTTVFCLLDYKIYPPASVLSAWRKAVSWARMSILQTFWKKNRGFEQKVDEKIRFFQLFFS